LKRVALHVGSTLLRLHFAKPCWLQATA